MKDIKNQVCERADDLIAFLYGELGAGDARKFERHLHECARCETEFASFGQIRQSIVAWRDESLGAWLPGTVNDRNLAANGLQPGADRRPSALAAIREFFNLSPLWLKGAAAFASLLFSVCAILAIGYLKDRRTSTVYIPSDKIYSRQDLEAQLAPRVQAEVDKIREQQKASSDDEAMVNKLTPRRVGNGVATVAKAGYALNNRLRKPLTRQERQELAVDLGLSAAHDEDDLDLVGDKINQAP